MSSSSTIRCSRSRPSRSRSRRSRFMNSIPSARSEGVYDDSVQQEFRCAGRTEAGALWQGRAQRKLDCDRWRRREPRQPRRRGHGSSGGFCSAPYDRGQWRQGDRGRAGTQQFELQYPGYAAPAIDLGLLARRRAGLPIPKRRCIAPPARAGQCDCLERARHHAARGRQIQRRPGRLRTGDQQRPSLCPGAPQSGCAAGSVSG